MKKQYPAERRNHISKIPSYHLPVTFEAGKGFVVAVFHIDNSTIGIKFESPDQLLRFFTELMENATIAWPNDPFIKYYLADDEST